LSEHFNDEEDDRPRNVVLHRSEKQSASLPKSGHMGCTRARACVDSIDMPSRSREQSRSHSERGRTFIGQ